MRTLAVFFALLLPAAALAADLTVKVVDPQSAAVAGAQVSLLCGVDNKTVIATQTTSAEGTATLPTKRNEPCQIRVLAPGFAEDFRSGSNRTATQDRPAHGHGIADRCRDGHTHAGA